MILSSADILRIIGGSEIIRLSATVKIVDGKPALSGAEGITIYVGRFPELSEFEATFTLWVESDEETVEDVILAELKRLLPKVQISAGLMTKVTTTEFRSESTQAAPEAPKAQAAQVDLSVFEERFQALAEDVQDRMLLVTSGRPGKDGQDGRDGFDGRDGRDLVATEVSLEELQNVEQIIAKEDGQVLTWRDGVWQNLFVPQVLSTGGSGGATFNDAVSSTVQWRYRGLTTGSDPQTGDFYTDTVDGDLVTVIRVSKGTNRGNDISVLIKDLLTQGYDRLYVAEAQDLSQAHLFSVTNSVETAGSFELTVVHVETAGVEPDFIDNRVYEFYISTSASGGGGGVPEAPIDGTQYARQDGAWSAITGGVWSTNGTTAYYNTGQVSIGTDSPPAADVLHLRGGAGSVTYPLLRFGYPATSVPPFDPVGQISFSDSAGVTAAAMVVRNNEGNWTAGSAHPCDIEFYATPQFSASAVERFTITGDGEVYVGTSSTKKVKVLDDGKVVLNLSFLPVYANAGAAFVGGEEAGTVCRDGNGNLFVAGAFG